MTIEEIYDKVIAIKLTEGHESCLVFDDIVIKLFKYKRQIKIRLYGKFGACYFDKADNMKEFKQKLFNGLKQVSSNQDVCNV